MVARVTEALQNGGIELPDSKFNRRLYFMNVVPLGDKVVVKRVQADEVTAGGIVLPDSAKQKPQQGRVLSIGDGILLADGTRSAPEVYEGDRVLFSSFAGTEIQVMEEELLIMSVNDILAVLD